jgi:hypothetical protein
MRIFYFLGPNVPARRESDSKPGLKLSIDMTSILCLDFDFAADEKF